MKRFWPLLCCSIILAAVLVIPVSGAELAGGYYVTGDSAMGNGLTFYVPSDFSEGSLTLDGSGHLFNLTASSVYLYCPQYPTYSIYAPRFSTFQYRAGSGYGYEYQDLNLRNITSSNVEIFDDDPPVYPSPPKILLLITGVLAILFVAYVVLPRR